MQVSALLKEVISNLNLQLNIYAIELVDANNFKCFVDSSQYLNKGKKITLDGVKYEVVDFELNKYVTLQGASPPAIKSHTLPAPYFTHGKLTAVNIELAKARLANVNINPLIWMFELNPRTRPPEFDTNIESTGSVTLFFMADIDFKEYETDDHYTQVIEPMENIVTAVFDVLDYHNRTGEVFKTTSTNHAKFTTGGGRTKTDDKLVIGAEVSGIEAEFTIPIVVDYSCQVREYPT